MTNGSAPDQRSSNLLTALFALLTGALVFLPSILGALSPPYVVGWLLPGFWILGCASMVCLGICCYALQFKSPPTAPQRLMGLGFLGGISALTCLAAYVALNMVQDRLAPVHLAAVDMTPTNVSVGDVVKLTGTARDENGDELTYTWSVDGQPVGNGQTVYWRAAVAPGTHGVSLAVDDGEVTHASKVEVSVFVKAKEPTMSHDDGGLIKGVRQALLSVEKRNPKAHGRLSAALTADDAIQKLAVEIDWADPSTRTRLLESAFLRAVDVFPEVMWAEWLKGKRPPCSQYPGTWPFCDPNK